MYPRVWEQWAEPTNEEQQEAWADGTEVLSGTCQEKKLRSRHLALFGLMRYSLTAGVYGEA